MKLSWFATSAIALALAGCTPPTAPEPSTPTAPPVTVTAPAPTSTVTHTATTAPSPTPTGTTPTGPSPTTVPTTIPTGAAAYADATVVAWGVGDWDTLERLATAEVVRKYRSLGPGGPNWDRTAVDAGAGKAHVTYTAKTGPTMVLTLDNALAGQGKPRAVVDVELASAPG